MTAVPGPGGRDAVVPASRRLIDLANEGGGPDNITCVVADVVDLECASRSPVTATDAAAS
jgi:serine/threonine protein phosphatase PrpC